MNKKHTNIKLLLTFEQNQTNTNKLYRVKKTPLYKEELLRCIEFWRRNAGWLKDIEIVIHTDLDLKLNDKNTRIIVKPFTKKLKSNYGFVNVHESGCLMHNLFKETTFIHIDLDMKILRELPKELFEKNTIGVYSKEDEKHQREKLFGNKLAETDFIISVNDEFYKNYFKYYNSIKKICNSKKCDDYDIEEYVADFLIHKFNYNTFNNYEIGQGFFNKIENPYFIHEHIYEKVL